MASGCLMGECPVCKELVWEDEWTMIDCNDVIIHERCRKQYIKDTYGISEYQFQRLYGAKELGKYILQLRNNLQESQKFYESRIRNLESQLKLIEKDGEHGHEQKQD
jgi:hypothetical protein